MKVKLQPHRRLANALGYDLEKFNKQVTVETHLRENLPRWQPDVVLDVGANVGQYGAMLRRVGYKGRIMSFEPGGEAFARLVERCSPDPLWDAANIALGDVNGEAELGVSRSSDFSSFHETSRFGQEKYGESMEPDHRETVAVRRLDDFLLEQYPDTATMSFFLKMDTQGHDHAVFEGAGQFKSGFCGIQSEISVTPIYEGVPDYIESLNTYRASGYEVTGLYVVNRHRKTGHVIEFDCFMAPREGND